MDRECDNNICLVRIFLCVCLCVRIFFYVRIVQGAETLMPAARTFSTDPCVDTKTFSTYAQASKSTPFTKYTNIHCISRPLFEF